MHRIEGGLRGLEAADDLDELHDRDWIEEVHADDLLGALGLSGEFGDGDGAGVGGEDDLGFQGVVEIPEEGGLYLEALGGGLDGEVGGGEVADVGGGGDAGASFVGLQLGELFLGYFAGEVLLDGCETTVERGLVDVIEENVEARAGGDVGDAVAHGSGAENYDGLDVGHEAKCSRAGVDSACFIALQQFTRGRGRRGGR